MVNCVKGFLKGRGKHNNGHVIVIHCGYYSVCQFKSGLLSGMVGSKTILAIRKKLITRSNQLVCCSFCMLPDPVHLISDKPRISIFMSFACLNALSNFLVAYKLLTLQVPILRGCLLVFKHPTSVCSLRDRFELHPSLIVDPTGAVSHRRPTEENRSTYLTEKV